jgi:ankyrin repeat protein
MGLGCSKLNGGNIHFIQPQAKVTKSHTCTYAEYFIENPLSPNSTLASLKHIVSEIEDVNKKNMAGETLLFVACEKGHFAGVEFLLNAGADKEITDLRGMSPLHIAIIYNHIEIVKILLKNDVNTEYINKQNNQGMLPIQLAVLYGFTDIVELLSKHGANMSCIDNFGRSLEEIAAANDHKQIQKLFNNQA